MDVIELKRQLSKFHIRPSKKLGQNFLLNEAVIDGMVAAADLRMGERVVEIGPGLGILTRQLAETGAEVLALEKDRELINVLRRIFRSRRNVKIINENALFFRSSDFGLDDFQYKIVANIPYNITGQFLRKLSLTPRPERAVLLLQKEVAERLTAPKGQGSILQMTITFYSNAKFLQTVSKENFFPRPQVDSAVVGIQMLRGPRFSDVDEKVFFQLIKMGFSSPRKQLHNNLTSGLPQYRGSIEDALKSAKIEPRARPQELDLEDWRRLYHIIFDNSALN